ncbi:hypothetical protein [Bradyrhizobium sp.]|jgi:hypothetical protein|uniref:hypothetical protein n=1 Tax=Bradyrhizobium sp. TaxID=376 RepID=UPI003C226F3A
MKLTTIALASVFAIGPTLALAQTGGSNADKAPAQTNSTKKDLSTTGSAKNSGHNSGDAITTGSDVPQNKPALSSSPESSDTSQKVK